MTPPAVAPQPQSIWTRARWLCNSVDELEAALREYRDAEEESDPMQGQGGLCPDMGSAICYVCPEAPGCEWLKLDKRGRIYAQNRVIDRAMRDIKREHHADWDLLHAYYRMECWKDVNRGWHMVAKMLKWDIPECILWQRCRTANDHRYALALCENGGDCPALKDRFTDANIKALHVLFRAVQRG